MAAPHPFRFGLSTRGVPSRDAWLTLAKNVEDLGYSTLLVPDHVTYALAPIAALAAAAEATTTLRLGCYVFGNDFRHPVILAKEAATLDVLSGGRLEFGLGSGWQRRDYDTTGIPLDPPGVRIRRLAEAVQVIKGCFADQPFSYAGASYTIEGLDLLPKPVQRPHPPLLIGGGGQQILSLAAREADIVGVNFRATADGQADLTDVTAEAAARKVAWIRQAAGERFDALELSVLVGPIAVTDGAPRQAADDLLQAWKMADQMSVEQLLASPQALIGSVEHIVETLQARREQYGLSYVVIREADAGSAVSYMDALAPVVARLAGT